MLGPRAGGLVLALFMSLLFPVSGWAQVAGSVEDGLDSLAKQIVQKLTAADRTTIAVLPFPNADGTCSVLSTYIVDELILSLFSVPESRLDIVERSQLEALIAELQLGEGGLLNPETTKRLGTQSGVSALTVGTITVIGDAIRLNARLVATDTGKTISAAAVTIPKTQAVSDLLARPVTTGSTCSGQQGATARRVSSLASPGSSAATGQLPMAARLQQQISDDSAQTIVAGIRAIVASASKGQGGKELTTSIIIENVSDHEIRLALVGPPPVATDNQGNAYEMNKFNGAGQCYSLLVGQISNCLSNWNQYLPITAYSILDTGARTTLNFVFHSDLESEGDIVSFSANFALLVTKANVTLDKSTSDKNSRDSRFEQTIVGLGIPNIQLRKNN